MSTRNTLVSAQPAHAPSSFRRRAAASRGRRARARCRAAAASRRFLSRSAGCPMNAAPKLSWRACRCWTTIRFDTISGTNSVSDVPQLAEPRAQQQLDARDQRSKRQHARGKRSLVAQSRAQRARSKTVASGTTISTVDADAKRVDDGVAHGEQRADCDELRRAAENVWAARAHWGGQIEDSLAVALIVLERIAHRLDDRARRDRGAGERVEVAAVAPHGPALRRRIRERASAEALEPVHVARLERIAEARRFVVTNHLHADQATVRDRSRPATRSVRDSRRARSDGSPRPPAHRRAARDRSAPAVRSRADPAR